MTKSEWHPTAYLRWTGVNTFGFEQCLEQKWMRTWVDISPDPDDPVTGYDEEWRLVSTKGSEEKSDG